MELKNIDFSYEIAVKKFDSIGYRFSVLSDAKSGDEVTGLSLSTLGDLEKILDISYSAERMSKVKAGVVQSSRINFGFDYGHDPISFLEKHIRFSAILRYVITLNSSGKPTDLELSLYTKDESSSRLLDIFDSIIGLPGLKVSKEAQVQVDRINSLKRNDFELNRYLMQYNDQTQQ